MTRLALTLLPLALAGCAAHYTGDAVADPYGFWIGIWHGFLLPWSAVGCLMSWLASLVNLSLFQSIEIVGRPSTGFFYYVGFFLGMGAYGGAAG